MGHCRYSSDCCAYILMKHLCTLASSTSPAGLDLLSRLGSVEKSSNTVAYLQVLMSDEQMAASAAAAAAGAPQLFGGGPRPHALQHSLDSQVSRMQLAQAALEKADMFKVSLNTVISQHPIVGACLAGRRQ